jgi:catechol 2,3-dioxygenase-like lactoylglutathione lyase family enzyme
MADMPDIDCVAVFPTLPVGDVRETAEWYQKKLGFDLRFFYGDPPTHGAVQLGQATLHFFPGEPNPDRHWLYLQVEDVDEFYEWIRGNGVETLDAPTDQPWRMREFNLCDLNGYRLRFGATDIRSGEPLSVERVPLDARIEKRLVALLEDLADHKKMTVGELLEETLLHSFETTPSMAGRWAASPHTARNLRYVEKLKVKHGIDYDTHDSFRFSERIP